MTTEPIKMESVHYNAATQSFEALVTVFGKNGTRNYACGIEAPITMSFEDAAEGLAVQARRRYGSRGGLHSRDAIKHPKMRAGRPAFDPTGWLRQLIGMDDRSAA